MSKVTNRKTISKFLPEKVSLNLETPLENQVKAAYEASRKDVTYNNLLREYVAELKQFTESYFGLSKEVDTLKKDYWGLVNNYDKKKAKEALGQIDELRTKILASESRIKSIRTSYTKALRKGGKK